MVSPARVVVHVFLLALLAAAAVADDYYGPPVIDVSGKKSVVKGSFQAPNLRAATLEITNGYGGAARAKSVLVKLNGVKVCTRANVNRSIGSASIPLLLAAKNKIKIVVKGSGARVRIRVVPRAADFDRLVGCGDSLLAGFQDGSLVETYQVWGFGTQIARQTGARFVLPLIREPGIPPRVRIEDGQLIIPDPDEPPGRRKNPNQQCDNLAVPGATAWNTLNTKRLGPNPLFEIILGGEETMIDQAARLEPTFVVLWIGANDVLGMATSTDPDDHTCLETFRRDYETVLRRLRATGASVVAANLPDVTTIAALVEPPTYIQMTGVPADALILINDLFNLDLSPDDYLTPDEVARIRATVRQFNAEIAKLCARYGVPLVDAYTLTRLWDSQGVRVAGQKLTTEFRDGIFSLDGIHPSNTAHALIANEFIDLINSTYGAGLAQIDVAAVLAQDPNRPASTSPAGIAALSFEGDPLGPALRLLRSGRKPVASERR